MLRSEELLTEATVAAYVARRGIVSHGEPLSVQPLGGGVSNVVLAVESPHTRVVVKQSLPRLRVADEWLANRERAVTEAEALRLAAQLTPDAIPRVFDVDPVECALVMELAPPGWLTWKEFLLAGEADAGVAARVGSLLAAWHRETMGGGTGAFSDQTVFDQLRVDPYYRTLARRRPELAPEIERHVERMLATRLCLVHGDYSPKNVLLGDGGLWVIDFEVAHVGDPVFDLAFMLNHLFLKAIHRPAGEESYRACAAAFWDAYREEVAASLVSTGRHLFGHLGCLMAARVDGKSPVEYLDESGREAARRVGASLLLEPPESLDAAWERM